MVTILLKKSIFGFHNESGGHRIQRIPPTEKRGRVHTSTVTVSVLEADAPATVSSNDEFEVRFHRGTGKGGQRRNKVATCCVVTHLPTGMTQKVDGRSREANEAEAIQKLRQEIERRSHLANHNDMNKIRASQIGSGMRGDKRRTYRFQDDRVVDHETGKETSCHRFMKGEIEALW